jgi:hypothetical protein
MRPHVAASVARFGDRAGTDAHDNDAADDESTEAVTWRNMVGVLAYVDERVVVRAQFVDADDDDKADETSDHSSSVDASDAHYAGCRDVGVIEAVLVAVEPMLRLLATPGVGVRHASMVQYTTPMPASLSSSTTSTSNIPLSTTRTVGGMAMSLCTAALPLTLAAHGVDMVRAHTYTVCVDYHSFVVGAVIVSIAVASADCDRSTAGARAGAGVVANHLAASGAYELCDEDIAVSVVVVCVYGD